MPGIEIDVRGPGWTFHRQVLRELIWPTLFTLFVLSVVVLTEDMLAFANLVVNRGFGAGTVASIALYRLLPAIQEILPFSVLIASLVALGRLGGDRELLALEASGVSTPRLLPPLLLFSAGVAGLALLLALFSSPWANRTLDETLEALAIEKPWASIEAGQVERFGDWKLRAREVAADGSRLGTVQLWLPDFGETAFAQRGVLGASPDGEVQVTLEAGAMLFDSPRGARQLRFDELTVVVPASMSQITRDPSERLAGLSLEQLHASGRWEAAVEAQRRFASPAAALIFGALALPLFLSGARFSRAGGWLLGVGSALVYYGFLQLASGAIESGAVGPVLGAWLPNLVFGAATLLLGARLKRMSASGSHLSRPERRAAAAPAQRRRRQPRRRALPVSIAVRFVELVILCFAAVLVAYVIIDLLRRADHLAHYGASLDAVLRYYAARIPLLASRVVPMSLLVATALTVAQLAARGELVAMRSCGIPAIRGLLPIPVLCCFAVPASFVLDDIVVPRARAYMDYVLDVQIKGLDAGRRVEVWYGDGKRFREAELFDPQAGVAWQLTVYDLGPEGLPVARSDASRAWYVGGGTWRMTDHVRVEVRNGSVTRARGEPYAQLGDEADPVEVDTRQLSVAELEREVRELEESGIDATAFRVDLYIKLVKPWACLILPALALFFALGGPPHPSVSATLVFCACVAAGYALLSGLGASLGYANTVGPLVAAIAPIGLFGAAAAFLALRLSVFR